MATPEQGLDQKTTEGEIARLQKLLPNIKNNEARALMTERLLALGGNVSTGFAESEIQELESSANSTQNRDVPSANADAANTDTPQAMDMQTPMFGVEAAQEAMSDAVAEGNNAPTWAQAFQGSAPDADATYEGTFAWAKSGDASKDLSSPESTSTVITPEMSIESVAAPETSQAEQPQSHTETETKPASTMAIPKEHQAYVPRSMRSDAESSAKTETNKGKTIEKKEAPDVVAVRVAREKYLAQYKKDFQGKSTITRGLLNMVHAAGLLKKDSALVMSKETAALKSAYETAKDTLHKDRQTRMKAGRTPEQAQALMERYDSRNKILEKLEQESEILNAARVEAFASKKKNETLKKAYEKTVGLYMRQSPATRRAISISIAAAAGVATGGITSVGSAGIFVAGRLLRGVGAGYLSGIIADRLWRPGKDLPKYKKMLDEGKIGIREFQKIQSEAQGDFEKRMEKLKRQYMAGELSPSAYQTEKEALEMLNNRWQTAKVAIAAGAAYGAGFGTGALDLGSAFDNVGGSGGVPHAEGIPPSEPKMIDIGPEGVKITPLNEYVQEHAPTQPAATDASRVAAPQQPQVPPAPAQAPASETAPTVTKPEAPRVTPPVTEKPAQPEFAPQQPAASTQETPPAVQAVPPKSQVDINILTPEQLQQVIEDEANPQVPPQTPLAPTPEQPSVEQPTVEQRPPTSEVSLEESGLTPEQIQAMMDDEANPGIPPADTYQEPISPEDLGAGKMNPDAVLGGNPEPTPIPEATTATDYEAAQTVEEARNKILLDIAGRDDFIDGRQINEAVWNPALQNAPAKVFLDQPDSNILEQYKDFRTKLQTLVTTMNIPVPPNKTVQELMTDIALAATKPAQ